jgi:outer membrane protein assembly factor BamB
MNLCTSRVAQFQLAPRLVSKWKGICEMRKLTVFPLALLCTGAAYAQFGRGGAEWSTAGGDAHRSSWVPTDPKISAASLQKPGFALTWKMKLNNEARQLNGLTPPTLLDRHIGIHGFRSFGFVGGSSDNIYAVDTDLARIDWQTHFPSKSAPQDASLTCPGGMTTGTARSLGTAFPAAMPAGRGGGGGGRGTAAKSAVGEPGEGGVTVAELAARAAAAAAGPGRGGPGGRGGGGGGRGVRMPIVVSALSGDGMLHTMFVSNGFEQDPPVKFLPPNANAQGLIIVDNTAYVATTGGCGGVPDGVWALDLTSKEVTNWKTNSGGVAGSAGPAFGPDGTVYLTTTAGDLVALEGKTLKVKDVYRAGSGFTSSPVIFQQKERTLIAAATKDGRIHLLDSAPTLRPVFQTPTYTTAADFTAGALTTWQDAGGTQWLLAPAAGPVAGEANFTVANGSVTNGAIVAWKVVEPSGAFALQPGWVSRDMLSPLTPLVLNGVIFAVSSGEFRGADAKMTASQRAQRSIPAVVYALDAATGKELWNSGKTITSFTHGGGLSAGGAQVFLGTHDGTLYAFGFPIEH